MAMSEKFYREWVRSYLNTNAYCKRGLSVLFFLMTFFLSVGLGYGGTESDAQQVAQKKTEVKEFKFSSEVKNEKDPALSDSKVVSRSKQNEGIPASYYLQVMLALFLIVVLIIAAAWLVKRLNFTAMKSAGNLKIESSLVIGQKEKLLILRVENERILLGITPQQINFLHQLSNVNDRNETPTSLEPKNFAEKLNTLLLRGKK